MLKILIQVLSILSKKHINTYMYFFSRTIFGDCTEFFYKKIFLIYELFFKIHHL